MDIGESERRVIIIAEPIEPAAPAPVEPATTPVPVEAPAEPVGV